MFIFYNFSIFFTTVLNKVRIYAGTLSKILRDENQKIQTDFDGYSFEKNNLLYMEKARRKFPINSTDFNSRL